MSCFIADLGGTNARFALSFLSFNMSLKEEEVFLVIITRAFLMLPAVIILSIVVLIW